MTQTCLQELHFSNRQEWHLIYSILTGQLCFCISYHNYMKLWKISQRFTVNFYISLGLTFNIWNWYIQCFTLWSSPLVLLLDMTEKFLAPSSLLHRRSYFIHNDKTSLSFIFSGLDSPSYLSLSSYDTCSHFLMIFRALCFTGPSTCMSVLYWWARNCTESPLMHFTFPLSFFRFFSIEISGTVILSQVLLQQRKVYRCRQSQCNWTGIWNFRKESKVTKLSCLHCRPLLWNSVCSYTPFICHSRKEREKNGGKKW